MLALLLGLAAAQSVTIDVREIETKNMWDDQQQNSVKTLDVNYYGETINQVTVAVEPTEPEEHIKTFYLDATLTDTMALGEEVCVVCMSVGIDSQMLAGDRGIGVCIDSPASLDEVLTVEAITSHHIRPALHNGWDSSKSFLSKDGNKFSLTLSSFDLNSDMGKNSYLGVRSQDNQLLKCFASPVSATDIPLDTDSHDISTWGTATGQRVNLKYMSNANILSFALIAIVGLFAF